ncbi:unnamed protein product [Closterium sp. Naga37s-1]|nr:unnamed protein product [Closterium sp. Naga37s-1]
MPISSMARDVPCDISNNSFYGPINSNFRSMIPNDRDLTNPSGGRCAPQGPKGGYVVVTRATANKRGEASLRQNCFTLNQEMECTANETQRSSDECLAFCSMSRELGPCDGHGACVPPQAGAAEARFTFECDDGFVPTNGILGSTCARPAPPPAAALSTGAVVGIAVGSAAALALLLAFIVALLWPRQRSEPPPHFHPASS